MPPMWRGCPWPTSPSGRWWTAWPSSSTTTASSPPSPSAGRGGKSAALPLRRALLDEGGQALLGVLARHDLGDRPARRLEGVVVVVEVLEGDLPALAHGQRRVLADLRGQLDGDRKSTRLNSSH